MYHINYLNAKHVLLLNNANIRLLKYEDLVTNPKHELKQVCDFFGVILHDSMIEHHTQFNAFIDKMSDKIEDKFLEHIKDFQSNTMKPVSTDLIDEWKKVLSPSESLVSEKINRDLDVFFKYSYSNQNYNFSFSDRVNVMRAWFEKKVYHSFYIQSPLWLKIVIKKLK